MSSHSHHSAHAGHNESMIYAFQFLNPLDPENDAAMGVPMAKKDARSNFLRIYKTNDSNPEKQVIPQIAEDNVSWLRDNLPDAEKEEKTTKKEFNLVAISSVLYSLKHELGLDYFLLQSRDRDEIFCKIFVKEEWLRNVAIENEYQLQFRSREKYTEEFQTIPPYAPANLIRIKEKNELLFKNYDKNSVEVEEKASLFTHVDKTRIVVEEIMKRIDLHALKSTGVMVDDFCVHEEVPLNTLKTEWATFRKLFSAQPLDLVHTYYAEKIALYFAWIQSYWNFMKIAAGFSLIAYILLKVFDNGSDEKEPIEAIVIQSVYAIFLALWASSFEQYWGRQEKLISWRWGTTELTTQEKQRPEFKGTFGKDEVTGKMKVLPNADAHKGLKRFCGYLVIAFFMLIVLVAVGFIFKLRYTLMVQKKKVLAKVIPAFLNALQIRILNIIYGKVAAALNDWENHETDNQHNDNLALKNFLFKFVNSYTALFYMAFLKDTLETRCEDVEGVLISCDSPLSTNTIRGCKDCMGDLGFQLSVIFITNMVMNVMELGLPWMKWKVRTAKENKKIEDSTDQTLRKELYAVEYDSKLEAYETPSDDYMEMLIQFGYVALFGVSSPIIAIFALVEITLEIRVDAWKICNLTRRPDPNRSDSIGIWKSILITVVYAGAITNSAILVFTSNLFLNQTYAHKVIFFIFIEHALFGIMYIVSAYIQDVPPVVTDGLTWGKRVVNEKLLAWKENAKEVTAEYNTSQGTEAFFIEKKDIHYQE